MFKQEIVKNDLVGKVRANKAGCLDFCEQGPTVVVYPEGVWYRIDDPENDVRDIVEQHCKNGKIVEHGKANSIFQLPQNEYTKKLITSVI